MSLSQFRAARRVAAVLLFLSATLVRAQDVATPKPALSQDQIEDFLLHARVRSTRSIGKGVTGAQRVTLTDGTVTHDAQVQTIDDARLVFQGTQGTELNFKDSYRYNIAAYRLARLLGLKNVPVSVERVMGTKTAAVTWWIDDVAMEEGDRLKNKIEPPDQERLAMQVHIMRVFDELIQNMDRNAGNMLWTKDWTLWMIDHTRAFRLGKVVRRPALLERCDRNLYTAMRNLTPDSLRAAVGTSLVKEEMESLLERRDAIVAHFDARVATLGEQRVLYVMR
jgi:hypothetical protein